MHALLCNKVFDGTRWHQRSAVLLDQGRVHSIVRETDLPADCSSETIASGLLVPGFIDLQVNGGGGVMLNSEPSASSIEQIASAHRASGTTALLPTVISDRREVHAAAIEAAVEARQAGHPGILGLHIEGPFFAPERRGAHKADMIRPLEDSDIDWLCEEASRLPIMLTLAPERCSPAQVRKLTEAGIRVCAGHSEASYAQVEAALAAGLAGFTHLFNAMSSLTSREPGMVGAALDHAASFVGIIADGHHVHPAAIRVAHAAKASGHLYLVSDAMATVGTAASAFEIYGETIREEQGRLVNSEGNLAGSAIGLSDAVGYCVDTVGLALEESLRMASLYPARFLGLEEQMGQLTQGALANICWLDDDLRVGRTWLAGEAQDHSASEKDSQ